MKYKFRAFNKKINKMVYLNPQEWPLQVLNEEDDWRVMMWTGLLDRHGKEIYEGDRIEFTVFDCFDRDTQFTGVVKYIGSRFLLCKSWECEDFDEHHGPFDLDWVHAQDDEIEIIGNIYENTELLAEETGKTRPTP